MNSLTDQQLLQDFAKKRSESAFAELTRRHIDFVYSAALRMVCDSHLAEDVTQNVFVVLSKNAERLTKHPVLSGWLHRTAQNLAANVVRTEVRRRAREEESAAMNQLLSSETEEKWESIAPHLDTALGELSEPDRDALLLRYFEKKSAREMAQVLHVSEDAAQKRVSRALEKLRDLFGKRNVTAGTSGLALLISANAVQTAPAGLLPVVATVISLAGTAAKTSTVAGASKILFMTTLQKTIVGATLAVAVGTGIYEVRENARLRAELAQAERGSIVRIHAQQAAHDSDMADLQSENERLKTQAEEVLKLRSEVGRLRDAQSKLTQNVAQQPKEPAVAPEKPNREINLPKAAWGDSGFATPEDALKTRGWAVLNGNREKFRESIFITDGARKILMDMFEKMVAANPNEAKVWVEGALKNNWDIEEGFLMPMMAENRDKGYAGYRVLSQEASGPNETILELETQMASAPARKETVKMQKFGENWKFVVDEEMLNRQMAPK